MRNNMKSSNPSLLTLRSSSSVTAVTSIPNSFGVETGVESSHLRLDLFWGISSLSLSLSKISMYSNIFILCQSSSRLHQFGLNNKESPVMDGGNEVYESILMPNLDQHSTKMLNLTVLQRIDTFVEETKMSPSTNSTSTCTNGVAGMLKALSLSLRVENDAKNEEADIESSSKQLQIRWQSNCKWNSSWRDGHYISLSITAGINF